MFVNRQDEFFPHIARRVTRRRREKRRKWKVGISREWTGNSWRGDVWISLLGCTTFGLPAFISRIPASYESGTMPCRPCFGR